jgi:hypothetical protein
MRKKYTGAPLRDADGRPVLAGDGGAPTNRERAEAAMAGVLAYAAARDGSPPGHPDDGRDAFRDLLSDMRHLADLRGWSFEEEVRISGEAYREDVRAPAPYPGAPPGAGLHVGGGALGSLEPGHPHNPARAREAFHERATEEG